MPAAAQPEEGPDVLHGIATVSRETVAMLDRFVGLITDWNRTQSLIAPSTLASIWSRHIADSAQLLGIAGEAGSWLDLGSGAGFPGVVVAILLAGRPGASVTLVESNTRKAAFLREALRLTGAPGRVLSARAEEVVASWRGPLPDAISSRALAGLNQLCGLIAPLSVRGVPAYFHKGEAFAAERSLAAEHWYFDLLEHPSRIGSGVIAEVRNVRPRTG